MPEESRSALDECIGQPLAMDTTAAAFGVSEVVDENMANAARVHAVENGEDPTDYTMIAFGGAAPLHAGRLCQKLGINRLLVPAGAGVGSAIGFLRAPFSFEATRSVYMRLSDFDVDRVRQLLEDLRQDATGFVRSCAPTGDIGCEFKVYMRYIGQGWEIPISLSEEQVGSPDAMSFLGSFEADYSALFGRTVAGLDTEITVWAANATTDVAEPDPVAEPGPEKNAIASGQRALFDPAISAVTDADVYDRAALQVDQLVTGPAVITEAETTIVVPSGFSATLRSDGTIELIRGTSGPAS